MTKIKDLSISIKLTSSILIIILILGVVALIISSYFMNKNFNHQMEQNIDYKLFNTEMITNLTADKALGIASAISEMELVKKSYEEFYQSGDMDKSRKMLQSEFSSISDKIQSDTDLQAKIHFHLPPAISLLRCWNGTGGDELSDFRNTILKVSETHQPVIGIEVGRAGLVVRGLAPIFIEDGKFAGSVEYILPFTEIQNHLVTGDKDEIGFYIRKDAMNDIEIFSKTYEEHEQSGEMKYHNFDSSSDDYKEMLVAEFLRGKKISSTQLFQADNFQFAAHPIYDFNHDIVGLVIYQEDITKYLSNSLQAKGVLLGFLFLLTGVSLILVFYIIRNVIIKPLRLLKEVSHLHSLGDVDQSIKFYSKDEMGSLAAAYRELQSGIKNIVVKTQEIAAGNFEVKIEKRSEKDVLSNSLNAMTQQLKESFREQNLLIAQSEQTSQDLQQIMDATSPICAINMNHEITKVNDAFCELYEKSADELLGRKCNSVIDVGLCKGEDCALSRIMKGEKKIEETVQTNLHNGKITNLTLTAIEMKDTAGNTVGLVESFIDITKNVITEEALNARSEEAERNNWMKTGVNELNKAMRGDKDVSELSKVIITFLAKYSKAQIGTIYLVDEDEQELKLTASYAYSQRKNMNSRIKFGEGIIGQSAYEKEMISLANVPENYIRINSSLGDTVPKNILVSPFIFEGNVLGVVELGSINDFSQFTMEFIDSAMKNIAISVNSAIARVKMKLLLDRTQQQSEELLTQQEELRASNEELEEKADALKASSEKLKTQQEELQATNEELEEKTDSLERQRSEILKQNKFIEVSKQQIEKKAQDLTIASKYKSEFLANMSHELRTPLNSLLILSRDLADNKKGNLENKQIESAEIIYNSGHDLLNLINEILDLSKIEAGKMTINPQKIFLNDLRDSINRNFLHQTQKRGIELKLNVSENLDDNFISDQQRVEQILKNLLSNAIKFTEEGSVTVDFEVPSSEMDLSRSGLKHASSIAISVTDTGIGIPEAKQQAIFEAFQQADGSTSRKFGGTGLGLSISRELAKLLGGELQLKSEVGKGSTFTFIMPITLQGLEQKDVIERRHKTDRRHLEENHQNAMRKVKIESQHIPDDRGNILENDRKILIVEDDLKFAQTLRIFCSQRNFKFLHAGDGESGVEMARKYIPDGIILDLNLPGINGWEVLDVIKDNPEIRHIPVHIMSALDESDDTIQKGAVGYLTKPVDNDSLSAAFDRLESVKNSKIKKLLLVEDNENMRRAVMTLLGDESLEITAVNTGNKAIDEIYNAKYDCVVLDITLPDISGFDILKKLKSNNDIEIPPVIIYTGKDITKEEEFELNKYTNSIIIKGEKSEDRLLDETALFLHQVVNDMPKAKQKIISGIHDKDSIFHEKRVLVVDDDMRNVFAVTHILEEKGIITQSAINGKKAIELLEKDHNFDLILMDIMMPVMDGYEAMKYIRLQRDFKDLKIIALTAKAMKGDKEKCIKAGANDYLTKPLQIDRLLSLMRVWMYK